MLSAEGTQALRALQGFAFYGFSNLESKEERLSFCRLLQTLLTLGVQSACTLRQSTVASVGAGAGQCVDTHRCVLSGIFLPVAVKSQHSLSAGGKDGCNQQGPRLFVCLEGCLAPDPQPGEVVSSWTSSVQNYPWI